MFINIYICIYIHQYLQYYAATYGICGIVWYVEFITDTDGLVGDYFRPATTLCNLATYPRTFDCVWNTFQNCYRYLIQIAKNDCNTIKILICGIISFTIIDRIIFSETTAG